MPALVIPQLDLDQIQSTPQCFECEPDPEYSTARTQKHSGAADTVLLSLVSRMERLANQRQQRAMLSLSIDNALSKKEAPIGFTPRTHLKTLICRVDALTKTQLTNSSCVGASSHDNQDSFLSARSTKIDMYADDEPRIGFTPRTQLKQIIGRVDALTKAKLEHASCVVASPHGNQDSFLSARSTAVDDDAGLCADDAQAVSFMFTPRLATVEENMYASEKGFDHVFEKV